jgi:hypothetical protein
MPRGAQLRMRERGEHRRAILSDLAEPRKHGVVALAGCTSRGLLKFTV